ncbi:ATPase, AAA family, putative helicase subunit of the Holliday junction resolvase [Mycoplasma yeatsii 13926]|uniref:ATPase, AAA family, putative helicase subunit of the Holliday junction resolvase n=1 Tax=Mycoplasma yeatsii 13926 TaxID=1188240 RepID=S6G3S1_9MOLU|nr:replication-associated recombination protein A [Mycoplasma yeatsii]EOA07481.1 ATPase, AAA family, putative helicase subunit of the Holliday junction resolvase [Mycoplasma yeatsii 13926]
MNKPLSFLLRPKSVKEIIGQSHILKENGLINKMIKNNYCTSLIFFGPSGVGKTSFAISLANDLNIEYELFNASYDKKEKLVKIIDKALSKDRFIVIIDEIHRLNKDKQDILLEYMEKGNIYVFSTTTENPFFVINPALRSRSLLIQLKSISSQEMFEYAKQLISENKISVNINDEALNYLSEICVGDVRSFLNSLELIQTLYQDEFIDIKQIKMILTMSKNSDSAYGDEFHDLKSALQKSIRGSDVDASLYYFSRLIELGDYETLMRRMVIMAYEDIGMANPTIPSRVVQSTMAFRQIGMPEGIIILGLSIVEMALSPKSNSAYLATKKAHQAVLNGEIYDIPKHLKDTHYKSAKKLGNGIGYKYPHDYKNSWVEQQYLPDEIKNIKFYEPKNSVYEAKVYELYNKMKNKK